jgi:DNA-binding HxlR family transcriptional regulator
MRKRLRTLTDLGILERRRQAEFPSSVDYSLAPAGSELLDVALFLQAWLKDSPDGPLELGTTAAKSAIRALTEGWSSTIIRAIAARPLSLTDLSRVIANLNYPSLERRLGAMRLAGQLSSSLGNGRSRPYTATIWLRKAIGPISAGARWERSYLAGETSPIGKIDIEAAFLLAVPVLRLSPDLCGTCRLVVETRSPDDKLDLAGVFVTVVDGRVTSCVSRLQGQADSWAVGSTRSWLDAVVEGDLAMLEIGGDSLLARALIEGLSEGLFAVRQAA